MDSQIGLLKSFFQGRFAELAASARPSVDAPATNIAAPHQSAPDKSSRQPSSSQTSSHLVLPDDPPPPTRSKLGSLGQIVVSNASTSASKKKGKAKEPHPDHKGTEAAAKKKDSNKKKHKDDMAVDGADGNLANAEVNGTAPKKKSKPPGGKKTVNSAKPSDLPPAIIASA